MLSAYYGWNWFSSHIAQKVFHIPIEERRGTGGFGADDSYKKLKTVMEKSGAKIEMSTGSKDQSLTFLITGKQESVLKARRDLLAQFQVRSGHK